MPGKRRNDEDKPGRIWTRKGNQQEFGGMSFHLNLPTWPWMLKGAVYVTAVTPGALLVGTNSMISNKCIFV